MMKIQPNRGKNSLISNTIFSPMIAKKIVKKEVRGLSEKAQFQDDYFTYKVFEFSLIRLS